MATFKVRARTVDMLGRQQIAGIPTAISELFKNAHDAYARNVEVDYFREDRLFVLRDDGLGMTREDFEQRWLTLGTESKLGSSSLARPPRDPSQPQRQIQGEKGIGRLAIAVIGPQVLVLTRAKASGVSGDILIAAYLHWGLFELPGIDLDEVIIPIREFKAGCLPSQSEVQDMVKEVVVTLPRLGSDNTEAIARIHKEMASFDVDPGNFETFLGEPSLVNGFGTHFYIRPADEILEDDIDNRRSPTKATMFEKNLIGFTNTMTPKEERPPIIARFRDHRDEGAPIELIGEQAFFTKAEFLEVDHHFTGRFDEYGQFVGQVGIYQTKPDDYILNWSESSGERTECGPFSLSFAYLQGSASESLVPAEEHTRLRKKLDRHGGLYIYRDGIRIQPYGDSDYDWLDIERNRNLGFSYYFYSYRRMFGAIEFTQSENTRLVEKAGREGFRENKAYRQLRSILMNFFLQTAGDFFREDGKYSEVHVETRAELTRNEEIRRRKAKQVRQRRAELKTLLEAVFEAIDEGSPQAEAEVTWSKTKREIEKVKTRNVAKERKALALMRIEKEGREQLHAQRARLMISRPRGVGLSRELSNQWNAYQVQINQLDTDVYRPMEAKIEEYVSATASKENIPVSNLSRLTSAVREYRDNAVKTTKQQKADIDKLATEISRNVQEEARLSLNRMNHVVDAVMAELETAQQRDGALLDIESLRHTLVNQIVVTQEQESALLDKLRGQLEEVGHVLEPDSYATAELTEALEEELDELRVQRDTHLELAQIGMALNTIGHEFDKTVGSMREGLRRLKAWADENPELDELYRELRTSFDHLDEYLGLFTPLDRRLYRSSIDISGGEILKFLSRLFESRLSRHNISLTATEAFLETTLNSYPSSIYPPFVNLVDNSIFWLQRNHGKRREIVLDADGDSLLIKDNGPGVSSRDRENIFAMNFSRKPGGRGMGLLLSRETLGRVGYELVLDAPPKSDGAVFRIRPSHGPTGPLN